VVKSGSSKGTFSSVISVGGTAAIFTGSWNCHGSYIALGACLVPHRWWRTSTGPTTRCGTTKTCWPSPSMSTSSVRPWSIRPLCRRRCHT
jgi:hypothetical protein